MKIGLISDIHGNLQALTKVLDELHSLHIDLILCAGDLVCYGAHPNRVIDVLTTAGVASVAGNYDDAVGWELPTASNKPSSAKTEPIKQAALDWTKHRITAANRRYLRSLPWSMHYRFGETKVYIVHAGLQRLDEWYPGDDSDKLRQLVEAIEVDVLVIGHTHQQFSRQIQGRNNRTTLVINPGSVGRSLDGDNRAAYAILDTTNRTVELVRTNYDLSIAIQAIVNGGMPIEVADLIFHAVRRVEDLPASVWIK